MKFSAKKIALFLLTISSIQAFADCNAQCCDPVCIDTCCGEFYVTADFLYWNAGANNLYYVAVSSSDVRDPIPPKDVFNEADLREPGYSWNPGVRASIGWRECDCGWDFALIGTYYKTTSKDKITKPAPDFLAPILEFLTPLMNPSFVGNYLGSQVEPGTARSRWDLTFGTIDALGGGRFTPWNCLTLEPNFGLRAAWINQRWSTKYSPVAFLDNNLNVLPGDESRFRLKSDYWGIGFKSGIDFEAKLCWNFSIIGGFGASLLFGEIEVVNEIIGHTIDPGAPEMLNNLHNTINRKVNKLACDLESELGLGYNFNCGCFGFNLAATYMFSIWFDQTEFRNFIFTSASVNSPTLFLNFQNPEKIYSNLVIHGVNVQVGMSF